MYITENDMSTNNILEEKVNNFINDIKLIESNFYHLTSHQMTDDELLDYLSDGKKKLEEKINAIDELCANIEKLFNLKNTLEVGDLRILERFIETLKLALSFLNKEYTRIHDDFEKYNFHKEIIIEYREELDYLEGIIIDLHNTFFELPKDENYNVVINDLI